MFRRFDLAKRRSDVAVHGHVHLSAPAEYLWCPVDLSGADVRQELVVGEIGTQQHQQVGALDAVGGRAVAE